MMYGILIIGLIFIGIGNLLTEKNAKHLLSGYNTMNEKEREKFNIREFLHYFKKFHFFLGVSIIAIGLLLFFFVSNKASTVIVALYSTLAYIYFIIKSRRFYMEKPPISNKLAVIFLSTILAFLIIVILLNY